MSQILAHILMIASGVWLGGVFLLTTALLASAVEQRVTHGRWRWPR